MNNGPVYDASLGAQLDKAVRKGQDNQTIGIPVGPDTSRIIAEIVAVSIDARVQAELKLEADSIVRNVDDWYIGFDNAGQAEEAIAVLAAAARDYELEISPDSKTRTEFKTRVTSQRKSTHHGLRHPCNESGKTANGRFQCYCLSSSLFTRFNRATRLPSHVCR